MLFSFETAPEKQTLQDSFTLKNSTHKSMKLDARCVTWVLRASANGNFKEVAQERHRQTANKGTQESL